MNHFPIFNVNKDTSFAIINSLHTNVNNNNYKLLFFRKW